MPTFNLMNPGQKISMVNLDECNDNIANVNLEFFLKSISYVNYILQSPLHCWMSVLFNVMQLYIPY